MSLISYDGDKCIRNAYYYNNCTNCVDVCPENLFSISPNKKIIFNSSLCTYCGGCLGTCPTEAIEMETFNPNKFTLEFKYSKETLLTCKNKTQCLSAFDSHHFSTMILNGDSLECDLSQCSDCEIGKFSESIKKRIEDSNKLLTDLKSEKKIEIISEIVESSEKKSGKRELFNKILGRTKSAIEEIDDIEVEQALFRDKYVKKMLPTKHNILVDTIKNSSEFDKLENIDLNNMFLNSKDFVKEKCTNCGDCIQFCPTESIFYSSDKLAIYFHTDKCIGCNICHDICKVDAIEKSESIELVDFLRPKKLLSFEMGTCTECKTPFIQRADEVICDRCINFTINFSGMLTLAKDM